MNLGSEIVKPNKSTILVAVVAESRIGKRDRTAALRAAARAS